MTTIRERAQAYLELASIATEGPWENAIGGVYVPYNRIPGNPNVDRWICSVHKPNFSANGEFIAASRTEGVWAAQKLLEALNVLEKIRDYKEGQALRYVQEIKEMARKFLEGSTGDDRE
jgi:hypothetical protein